MYSDFVAESFVIKGYNLRPEKVFGFGFCRKICYRRLQNYFVVEETIRKTQELGKYKIRLNTILSFKKIGLSKGNHFTNLIYRNSYIDFVYSKILFNQRTDL